MKTILRFAWIGMSGEPKYLGKYLRGNNGLVLYHLVISRGLVPNENLSCLNWDAGGWAYYN